MTLPEENSFGSSLDSFREPADVLNNALPQPLRVSHCGNSSTSDHRSDGCCCFGIRLRVQFPPCVFESVLFWRIQTICLISSMFHPSHANTLLGRCTLQTSQELQRRGSLSCLRYAVQNFFGTSSGSRFGISERSQQTARFLADQTYKVGSKSRHGQLQGERLRKCGGQTRQRRVRTKCSYGSDICPNTWRNI